MIDRLMPECKTCRGYICKQNKSGYCRPCWNKAPEKLQKQSDTMKAKWRDPKTRKILTEAGTRNLIDSGGQAKAAASAKAKQTWRIASQHITSDHREKAKRTQVERKLGHIPRECRPMYYDLTRKKKIPAADASALVLEHHEREMQKFRRKLMAG